MEQHTDCSYCMCGTDNTLVDAFGIPMLDLPASNSSCLRSRVIRAA